MKKYKVYRSWENSNWSQHPEVIKFWRSSTVTFSRKSKQIKRRSK